MWRGVGASATSLRKSSVSIILTYTKPCRIPASASENQGHRRGDLVPLRILKSAPTRKEGSRVTPGKAGRSGRGMARSQGRRACWVEGLGGERLGFRREGSGVGVPGLELGV